MTSFFACAGPSASTRTIVQRRKYRRNLYLVDGPSDGGMDRRIGSIPDDALDRRSARNLGHVRVSTDSNRSVRSFDDWVHVEENGRWNCLGGRNPFDGRPELFLCFVVHSRSASHSFDR